ncbi:NAD-dependent epimerase/dehydratase family protein [Actomonas aquatica]|uniref:SDR family oxidoreductase n=1 Tax=Actomonas aquatica TaxID=2866162 RepID=A0ABZ1CCC5_9BACT|nr:SDR family oxidoreductase [Opitutus sp. WL0086]WRQ89322.1 SDR family oxidoreductase [Opitutus sp. WL0086]
MNLLVTGGCGYIGAPLTQTLLALGHDVTVIDAQWHGCNLPIHPRLNLSLDPLPDLQRIDLASIDAIVHLAGIADPATAATNPELVWSTNVANTTLLLEAAINAGVKHFVHCSAAAIYGNTLEGARTEADLIQTPDLLSKSLLFAERLVQGYRHDLRVDVVRPGLVCGVSPRMRLDLPVNLFTMQALTRGRITVEDPTGSASHTHLRDLVRLFVALLERETLPAGLYNAGFETVNHLDLALRVAHQIPCDLEVAHHGASNASNLDSSRLQKLGFQPTYKIDDAIWEIAAEHRMGRLSDREAFYNRPIAPESQLVA